MIPDLQISDELLALMMRYCALRNAGHHGTAEAVAELVRAEMGRK